MPNSIFGLHGTTVLSFNILAMKVSKLTITVWLINLAMIALILLLGSCSKTESLEPVHESKYIKIGFSINRGNAAAYWINNGERDYGQGLRYFYYNHLIGDTISVRMGGIIYVYGYEPTIGFKLFHNGKESVSIETDYAGYIDWKGVVDRYSVRTISLTKN